ncbi:MAG: hypothetical protein AB7L66_05180 [Gemmatimonadales bacterium]
MRLPLAWLTLLLVLPHPVAAQMIVDPLRRDLEAPAVAGRAEPADPGTQGRFSNGGRAICMGVGRVPGTSVRLGLAVPF